MASFLLMVHSANYANQSSRSALKYAQAVINRGHQLKAVFFYQDGVYHANAFADIPSDELDTQPGFNTLHCEHDIPLLLCVTAAEKRGTINQQQDHRQAPSFTIAGLAEMAEIAAQTDYVVQFK
ncbi:MAG: tRNA 2-thiouridine synthesizing protein D [Phenylobacterium sp.]|jgi:tRNA 2-thiouridine synthesizing protein D